MEACEIDQFEMHVRAVMNLPCPPPKMKVGVALMLNILGEFFFSFQYCGGSDVTNLGIIATHSIFFQI
jgi:phosphoribosylaminoimidazole carboxylase (NCAIR synthetase)